MPKKKRKSPTFTATRKWKRPYINIRSGKLDLVHAAWVVELMHPAHLVSTCPCEGRVETEVHPGLCGGLITFLMN